MENGYSICFNQWALDKNIRNDLRLLVIISSLTARDGYCFASNKYLAELFDETEVSISNKIKNLEKNNYIEIDYEKKGCQITTRRIRLKNILIVDKKDFNGTIKKYFKENNTSINNTSINNYNNNSEEPKDTLFDLIEQNFMRQLSPMDYEQISLWEDNELTRYAIRDTVLKNIYSIKYIDTVLQSYKKKGIKTVEQARQETERIKEQKERRNYTPKKSTTQETLERWRGEIEQVRSERLARKN